jgi:hypothetical protein
LFYFNILVEFSGGLSQSWQPSEGDTNLAAIRSAFGHLNHPKSRTLNGPTCGNDHAALGCARLNGVLSDAPTEFPLLERRNTMRKIFFALTLLSISVSAAIAQQRSGTPDEQKACSRDVSRFCRTLMDQGDFVILACLKENRPKLTKACNQVLISHGQ